MKNEIRLKEIGYVKVKEDEFRINLSEEYNEALKNIEGYSHLQIIWWANRCDKEELRKKLILKKLFKNGPDEVGTFATRSPVRPNPIMVSTVKVEEIDNGKCEILVSFIDALDQSPVLDIKPYNAMERVRSCNEPKWCNNWPIWYEDAINYNWEKEMNFKK